MSKKVTEIRKTYARIIGDRLEDSVTKFGAIIAQGIIDAGKELHYILCVCVCVCILIDTNLNLCYNTYSSLINKVVSLRARKAKQKTFRICL